MVAIVAGQHDPLTTHFPSLLAHAIVKVVEGGHVRGRIRHVPLNQDHFALTPVAVSALLIELSPFALLAARL